MKKDDRLAARLLRLPMSQLSVILSLVSEGLALFSLRACSTRIICSQAELDLPSNPMSGGICSASSSIGRTIFGVSGLFVSILKRRIKSSG